MRKGLLHKVVLGALCGAAALLVMAPSALAQSAGACQLNGTASFSPGLNTGAQNFNYGFSGSLSGCQSSQAGAPSSGTVSAGQKVTISAEQFQEPVPTGNGSCLTSTTGGTAIATWSDGTQTVVQYSTTGAAAAVALQGTVVPSVTLPAVNPGPGQPTSTTITTTRYAGSSALGVLTFQPPDPTACNTPTGVTSAAIGGAISLLSG